MSPTKVTTGEFAGWQTWETDPFEHGAAGPFYFRTDEAGPVTAFRAEQKHMNGGNVMHGGCLMTFADFSLFALAHEDEEGVSGVTVAFNAEFLSGAVVGDYIEARGDVLRNGKSLIFVRGIVTAEGRPVLNFSGTIKKKRKQP